MKRLMLVVFIIILTVQFYSCSGNNPSGGADNTLPSEVPVNTPPPEEPKQTLEDTGSYQNPVIKVNDENTWSHCGIGDPFVMRYNGRYYLYCSTKDVEIGIQCWTSEDLVNWEYTGLCAKEALTKGAYAPEVVYYNGYFYMYTSPGGYGHYVLKSESPTGPFVAITGNFGLSIDGDVFIDDDGSWYFYSAAFDGIMVYPMSAPDRVEASKGRKILCDMNGWTEGSMIVKYDGTYYMTYTGNYVWSPGYRINYAISNTSPLDFTPAGNNPLLLSTDINKVMGIGHSSTVLGPNLDEYYIVYHSYEVVPQRNMNIDRVIFNGTDTVALGPTIDKQQAPQMPDIYSRFETESDLENWNITNGSLSNGNLMLSSGGRVISKDSLSGNYTAEYNIKSISDKAGVLFGYKDDQNYGEALYDAETGELTISFTLNGNTTKNKVLLNGSFSESLRSDALIQFRLYKSDKEYSFFVNGRKVFSCENELSGGAIGVFCKEGSSAIGFVGGTLGSLQSTFQDVYKPVENIIPAFSCLDQDEHKKHKDGIQYLQGVEGESYTYKTNVSLKGKYDFVMEYRSSEEWLLELYQDNVKLGEILVPGSENKDAKISISGFDLKDGLCNIRLCVKQGNSQIFNFYFHVFEEIVEINYDFQEAPDSFYQDGEWRVKNGKLMLRNKFGKYMLGSENWSNYIVESDITITTEPLNAGLCVRVSDPATLDAEDFASGTDYLRGYFIGFGEGSIVLGKHNYNWKELERVSFPTNSDQTYRLKVEAEGNVLRISVDGNLVITYVDNEDPFLHGMVGYRAHSCLMTADNLTIKPIN